MRTHASRAGYMNVHACEWVRMCFWIADWLFMDKIWHTTWWVWLICSVYQDLEIRVPLGDQGHVMACKKICLQKILYIGIKHMDG